MYIAPACTAPLVRIPPKPSDFQDHWMASPCFIWYKPGLVPILKCLVYIQCKDKSKHSSTKWFMKTNTK